MNVKQLLQQLMGEVWELDNGKHSVQLTFMGKGVEVRIEDRDELSYCSKRMYTTTADSVLSLIDFLQANTKEGK